MRPETPESTPRGTLDSPRSAWNAPRVVLGVSWGAPGAPLAGPGLLWGAFWGGLGALWEAIWSTFLVRGGLRSENGEILKYYIPYNTFAMFLRPQGLQNEARSDPEAIKERREAREEHRRERRGRLRGEKSSILVTVSVSRVWGGVPKLPPTGGANCCGGVGF